MRNTSPEKVLMIFSPHIVEDVHILSSYKDYHVRALIHEAKFHGNARACSLLNVLVATYLQKHLVQSDLIIPIPLSSARMRERGYNQVTRILSAGTSITIPVVSDILVRKKHTRPQTELKRNERLVNMRDAFGVAHPERITGKHIILVDDVMTTGATLREAKASLLPHSPASVILLALAH